MWSVVGHEAVIAALDSALGSEPAHAYAFVGPEGVGKRTLAIEFAAALNCTGENKPCLECRPCRDTIAGKHPDVEIVEPGSICDESEHGDHAGSRDLRICQVRRLERVLSGSSYTGGRRVAIVDAADTLRTEAANAFLKTLEEPPPGTVIVLLIEREERIPETVLSRCQRQTFRRVERDKIAATLQERGASSEQAAQIAAMSGGRLGWALSALEEPSLLDDRRRVLETARSLAHAGRFERFEWARDAEGRGAAEARERYLRDLELWETWWRDVLTIASGAEQGLVNQDFAAELAEEGRLYEVVDVIEFLRALHQTREYLQTNVDVQLALENLMLDLPRPRSSARA